MKLKDSFEIIDVSNEYMAVPVGEEAKKFKGVVVLSEPAAFLLNNMKQSRDEKELLELLIKEYDVDFSVASKDLQKAINSFFEIGLIEE